MNITVKEGVDDVVDNYLGKRTEIKFTIDSKFQVEITMPEGWTAQGFKEALIDCFKKVKGTQKDVLITSIELI